MSSKRFCVITIEFLQRMRSRSMTMSSATTHTIQPFAMLQCSIARHRSFGSPHGVEPGRHMPCLFRQQPSHHSHALRVAARAPATPGRCTGKEDKEATGLANPYRRRLPGGAAASPATPGCWPRPWPGPSASCRTSPGCGSPAPPSGAARPSPCFLEQGQ